MAVSERLYGLENILRGDAVSGAGNPDPVVTTPAIDETRDVNRARPKPRRDVSRMSA